MDRRTFIGAAASLSAVATLGELGAAGTPAFDPTEQDMTTLLAALASGTLTSEMLTVAYLARIARFDRQGPEYRAVLAVNPNAVADARARDVERKAQQLRGPLHGLPLILKDNIETSDPLPTTAGSFALARAVHAGDAPLAARLRAAGAVILGKSNLSEWANFRSSRSTSGWSGVGGQTRNAYARDRSPSGSSAGSAVAASLSFCAGAVGTETNGSILSPASLNGVVGLKPTLGLVSGRGVVPISPRQDTAGPLCRTVTDAALLATVMAERPLGFGARGGDLESFRLRGVRIGVMPIAESAHPDTGRLYADARSILEREGAELVELRAPAAFAAMEAAEGEALLYEFKDAINAYLAMQDPSLVPCRTLAHLIDFNRAQADAELVVFGQDLFEKAEMRGPLTDAKYQKALAQLRRAADTDGLTALLGRQDVDLLLAPGNGPAERIDEVWGDRDGGGWPQIASAAAIAGYPSISVPAGAVFGLPVGITFVGRRGEDGFVLQVARAYERAGGRRMPPRPVL